MHAKQDDQCNCGKFIRWHLKCFGFIALLTSVQGGKNALK